MRSSNFENSLKLLLIAVLAPILWVLFMPLPIIDFWKYIYIFFGLRGLLLWFLAILTPTDWKQI